MVEIVLVAAVAENGVIGHGAHLPWRLPTDMKHFRALTLGKPLIMGRRTFVGIGHPLPGRTTIVLSRDPTFRADAVEVVGTFEGALARGRAIAARDGADAVIVAGGAEVYAAALAVADRIELTEVALHPDGDTHFPAIDRTRWRESARSSARRGESDDAAVVFVTLTRLRG